MKFKLLCLIVALLFTRSTLAALDPNDDTDYMLQSFDDLAEHFEGAGAQYPRDYYTKLVDCLGSFWDKDMHRSQIGAWKGMADYWHSNGTMHDFENRTDFWGECIGSHDDRCLFTEYTEYNQSKQEFIGRNKILIYEPCNHVSNLAFLHGATKICDYPNWSMNWQTQRDQKRAFASLAAGSAFFHGSHTYVGYSFDNLMISVISYIAHQTSVENFGTDNTELYELSPTPRSMNSSEVVNEIMESFKNDDVPTWAKTLWTTDYPKDYVVTFAAIVSTICYLIIPNFWAHFLMASLVKTILPAESQPFMLDTYLPAIGKASTRVILSMKEKHSLLSKFIGTLMKLIFAFLYQEKRIKVPGFKLPIVIQIGGHMASVVNFVADLFTMFPQTDKDVNRSVNVYPGQATCKFQQGHSIWHEMSSNGLLDLVYLCDYIHSITKDRSGEFSGQQDSVFDQYF